MGLQRLALRQVCMPSAHCYALILFSISVLILELGCASTPSPVPMPVLPSEEARAHIGTVGVVMAAFPPTLELYTPAKGTAEGAARGAETTFETMAGIGGRTFQIPSADPFASSQLAGLIMLALSPAGALAGAVSGAVAAESAEVVEKQEAIIRAKHAAFKIQEDLRDHVVQMARQRTDLLYQTVDEGSPSSPNEAVNFKSLKNRKLDTILDLGVLTLGLRGEKAVNPLLALVMSTRVRLMGIEKETILYQATLECWSPTRAFSDWAVNNAEPLRAEYGECLRKLSDRIVDEVFLVSYVSSSPEDLPYPIYGLPPEYPEVRFTNFVEVPSLQPTLRWKSFPYIEGEKLEALQNQIRNLTYDLRIWRAERSEPQELVYLREGLGVPFHRVEEPLKPGTQYFWSVRAHFDLDGKPRRSAWGMAGDPSALHQTIPNIYCYRFMTP